jgi:hypothetical protein
MGECGAEGNSRPTVGRMPQYFYRMGAPMACDLHRSFVRAAIVHEKDLARKLAIESDAKFLEIAHQSRNIRRLVENRDNEE